MTITAIIAALPLLGRVPDAATDHATWIRWQEGLSVRFTLLEPIGYIPPAEAAANYYRQFCEQTASV